MALAIRGGSFDSWMGVVDRCEPLYFVFSAWSRRGQYAPAQSGSKSTYSTQQTDRLWLQIWKGKFVLGEKPQVGALQDLGGREETGGNTQSYKIVERLPGAALQGHCDNATVGVFVIIIPETE